MTQPDHLLVAQWSPLAMLGTVWPYLLMLIGFSLIVCVHELGHFAVAKWVGVRVEKFAVGFGREIFGFTRGETRYSFNILPLGGYVKMLGQEDFDDKSKELQFKDDPRSFINKPIGQRAAIVSAGVIMNVLFACLLFMIVFLVGMEVTGTRIAVIEPDSPAQRAGLLPGDDIKQINGENVLEFNEVRMAVILAPLHEPIEFVVKRDGELKFVQVEPEYTIPESTRDIRRQIVGIQPGVTRKIIVVGPEIDQSRPDQPHVGDVIVEIDGVEVTDQNASEVINTLVYVKGDVYVSRKDPKDPDAPAKRVKVDIPPIQFTCQTTERVYPMVISQVSAAEEAEVLIYVLASHRAEAANLANAIVDPDRVEYDPDSVSESNYEALLAEIVAENGGLALVTEFADEEPDGWEFLFWPAETDKGVMALPFLTRLRTVIARSDMTVDFEFQDAPDDEMVHADYTVVRKRSPNVAGIAGPPLAALLVFGVFSHRAKRSVRAGRHAAR